MRFEDVRIRIGEKGYDAYLATDEMNIRYITGIPVPQRQLLLMKPTRDATLYVLSDGLRTAKTYVGKICTIKAAKVAEPSALGVLIDDLKGTNLKRVAIDTMLADEYLKLAGEVANTKFVFDPDLLWALRAIKSPEEVGYFRRSAKIADAGQRRAAEVIKAGMHEYEVGAEVDYAMGCLGSEDEGHKTIVTSGPRTALANTSGHITDREIREGDLVVVDTGATVKGYRTDLGRAYVVGKPTPRQQEIHRLVRGAWKAAFQAVRPGAIADDLDVAARKVLGNYEQYFNQEAGHGIGLSFEPPFLGKGRKDVLKENMVLAVEIGLYMDDFGGILIEDTVLVTKSGAECLTTVSSGWPK